MKKNRFWFFLLFVAMTISLSAAPVKSADPVNVVFEEWAPYQFTENGVVSGTDTEILKEIGNRLGIEFSFESVPWARALKSVDSGAADAIFSLAKNDEREKTMIFPKTPINSEKKVFFSLSKKNIKVTKLSDLAGLKVGIVRGNFFGKDFDNEKGFTKVEASSQEQLFRMLAADRFDVCLTSDLVGMAQAKALKISSDIIQQPFILSEMPLYIAFSRASKKNAEKLAEDFSKVYMQLQEEGIVKKILSKYSN